MNNQKNYWAGVAAFTIWGFFSLPLRALQAYSAGEILFFRILFSAILLAVLVVGFRKHTLREALLFFRSQDRAQRRQTIWLTVGGAILLTINWLVFIYVMNQVNVKTASFSYLICPVLTAVLGYVLLREQLSRVQWAAVGLCGLSCLLIGMGSAAELYFSLATALSYALYLISQRKNQGFDRLVMLGVQVGIALTVLVFALPLLVAEVPTAPGFYGIIFIIAAGFTILPLFLNLFALNQVNSATIGILMYINPLMNFFLAITFFGEQVTPVQAWGYTAIFAGLLLFNYPVVKRLQAKRAEKLRAKAMVE